MTNNEKTCVGISCLLSGVLGAFIMNRIDEKKSIRRTNILVKMCCGLIDARDEIKDECERKLEEAEQERHEAFEWGFKAGIDTVREYELKNEEPE